MRKLKQGQVKASERELKKEIKRELMREGSRELNSKHLKSNP